MTAITRITGRSISPNPNNRRHTQKNTRIPNRHLTVLPAVLLPQNNDIRIQNTNRFINISLTLPSGDIKKETFIMNFITIKVSRSHLIRMPIDGINGIG